MITEKIISVLEKDGVLNRSQVAQLKQFRQVQAGNVLDFLSQYRITHDRPIDQYLREVHKLRVLRLEDLNLKPEVVKLLPRAVCFEHHVVAFHQENGTTYLAMADPENNDVLNFLTQHLGQPVVPYLADKHGIVNVLRQIFDSTTDDLQERISELIVRVKSLGSDPEVTAKEMPVIKLLDHLIAYSLRSEASDMHFEPTEQEVIIRLRVDGLLHEVFHLPKQVHAPVVARVKILAKMRIDEHQRPQDARFTYAEGQDNVAIRVSIVPTLYGQKCVLRFLDTNGVRLSLDTMGLEPSECTHLEAAIRHPHGLILVSGPTGSGKTTSLYSLLNILRKEHLNISTIEDPVEYHVPGITQIQVNPSVGLTFATGLRSILRQDPDIILVGEIRDKETADIAINAALTGHVVLSTLHTNTASAAVTRLLDLGVEPFLIASTVRMIMNQRLIRTRCPACRATGLSEIGARRTTNLSCEDCFGTGYAGRVGIFELLLVTEQIQDAIMKRSTARTIEKIAIEAGMKTLRQAGQMKVDRGQTTMEEVLRVIS